MREGRLVCERVLSCKSKGKRKEGAKKDEPRSFWCSKEKIREITWVGHMYAKGNSELITHLTTFNFLKFTNHPL